MNTQNIKNVLQENDRLCYEYDSSVDEFSAAVHEVYTVNYADKIATVVSCFNQCGVPAIVTTVYSNGKASHFYNGLADDDEIVMSSEEYNAMFENGGFLRPVKFEAIENTAAYNGVDSLDISYQVDSNSEMKIGVSDKNTNVKMAIHVL